MMKNEDVVNAMLVPGYFNVQRNSRVLNSITNTVSSNKFIHSLSIYIPYNGMVFSSDKNIYSLSSFYDNELLYTINKGEKTKQFDLREIEISGKKQKVITMTHSFPQDGRKKLGEIIINIDPYVLYKSMGGENIGADGVFVTNTNGEIFLHQDMNLLGKICESPRILDVTENTYGYVYDDTNEGKQVIFFTSSNDNNWKFLYSVDINMLKFSITDIWNTILTSSALYILLGLFVSMMLARNLYKPIKNLTQLALEYYNKKSIDDINVNEYDFLKSAYRDAIKNKNSFEDLFVKIKPEITKSCINHIVFGDEKAKEEGASVLFAVDEKYQKGIYVVLVAQVDDFKDFVANFTEVERNLLTLSLITSIEKCGDEEIDVNCIACQKHNVLIFLHFNRDIIGKTMEKTLENFSKKIRTQISEQFPFTLTICIGNTYTDLKHISKSYNQAMEALKYKLYLGSNRSIHAQLIENGFTKNVKDEEIKIKISALMSLIKNGDKEECICSVNVIFESIKSLGFIEEKEMKAIIFSIFDMLIKIMVDNRISIENTLGENKDLYKECAAIETIEKMNLYITDVVELIKNEYDKTMKKKSGKYIQIIEEYIEKNYENGDISLSVLADYVGINSSYLSKIFKENFNESFTDYINIIRVERTKVLLKNTQMTIREIGFRVGFNTMQNFIRVFKKYENMTPSMYREKN